MPKLRTKKELANIARSFATMKNIVEYQSNLYMPVDFMTALPGDGDPTRTVWILLDHQTLRQISNNLLHILFATDAEERSFKLMVRQQSQFVAKADGILVRWKDEQVKVLTSEGKLIDPDGSFVPNYLNVPYDPDNDLVGELQSTLEEWLGSKSQAQSLLRHLSTALQPDWSAVKYLLLIGEGRNGKGTLLKMLWDLFGRDNISKVTRQAMSGLSPIMATMNGKLLNIVFDGPKEFLKDSSTEKTVIAGEPIAIEMKYENVPLEVQTNALFLEALNSEPRTGDKSPALQKRLARFSFNNVYALDHSFEEKMRSPKMLAALLHLLLENWVHKHEAKEKLNLTAESLDMQLAAVWNESPVLRFLEYTSDRAVKFLDDLELGKVTVDTFLGSYRPWLGENGYKNSEDSYLLSQLKDHFVLDRKTFRIEGRATTRRYIKAVLPDTANAIQVLRAGGSLSGAETEDEAILRD